MTPCQVRYTVNYEIGTAIPNGGWHFSYIGDVDKVIAKIESSAHQEYNKAEFKDKARVQEIIDKGVDLYDRGIPFEYVEVDDSYPTFVKENITTFKKKEMLK